MPNYELEKIIQNFDIPKSNYEFETNSNGLINKSYAVKNEGINTFFLQQIDHSIFKDIKGLMYNIEVVCAHFKTLKSSPNHLDLIYTRDHKPYYKSINGEYWRLYTYMNGQTFFKASQENIAKEAGRAYGNFLGSLSTLDPSALSITIPEFHNITKRYSQFILSLKNASTLRLQIAKPWINLVEKHIDIVTDIYLQITTKCPSRISHNDTKLSNLLFDEHQKAKCVVDYDTLMAGFIPLDFGDSVRTICSTTVEDDPNFSVTQYDMAIFIPFAKSFINSFSGILTEEEMKMLPKSTAYMPFLMGLRMLTDFLNNDIYYATHYENHNLDRAANQLTLFKSAVLLEEKINKIINS